MHRSGYRRESRRIGNGAAERAQSAKKEAQKMAKLMSGIDPTDPAAIEEMRKLLLRHKGWERVE